MFLSKRNIQVTNKKMPCRAYAGRFIALFFVYALLLQCVQPAMAGGSWGADSGMVDLSRAYEDGAAEDFRQAVALLNYGYDRRGARRLRRLLRRHPGADWAGAAHYHLGLAYCRLGRYERAFGHFGEFVAGGPAREDVRAVQELQLRCAAQVGKKSPAKARPLFDELAATAHSESFAAACRWTIAGLLEERRRFLAAKDAYIEFVDYHPLHENAPEAWFKIAECQYNIALLSGRGMRALEMAEAALKDFLTHFSGHERTEEAERMLDDVMHGWAERTARVAEYYLKVRGNPHAALDYLRDIEKNAPDVGHAAPARERIGEIEEKITTPRPGGYIPMPLDGIGRIGER